MTGADELRQRFVAEQGSWSDDFRPLLDADPEMFAAYCDYAGVPWRTGTLEPKVRELIGVAVHGSATSLHVPGLRRHIGNALDRGATEQEIVEVLELVSVLGVHAVTMGVPVLVDELRAAGTAPAAVELTERQRRLKEDFVARRGYWAGFWDDLFTLDTDFFEAYLEFCTVPWRRGALDARTKELVYVAIDAAATHLYEPGLRIHLRNAGRLGVTPTEILEVYQLVSTIGITTMTVGLPLLAEALRERGLAQPDG